MPSKFPELYTQIRISREQHARILKIQQSGRLRSTGDVIDILLDRAGELEFRITPVEKK